MTNIIVVTHGPLATALLQSAQMVIGEQPTGVVAIPLGAEDDLESARAKIAAALHQMSCRNGVQQDTLVLVDLFGGTAANAAAWALRDCDFQLVAGVSLLMLLEVLLHRGQMSAAELAELAVRAGQQGIADVRAVLCSAPASAADSAS